MSKIFRCEDCVGGPCEWSTDYPIKEEGAKPTQCPVDEHGCDSAVWVEVTESIEKIKIGPYTVGKHMPIPRTGMVNVIWLEKESGEGMCVDLDELWKKF